MNQEVTYDGNPTTGRIEEVLTYDAGGLADMLTGTGITEDKLDLNNIESVVAGMMVSDPSKFIAYQVRQKLSGTYKTVMLATGLTLSELKEVPLKELYEKSVKALGGTADEYFLGLGINTTQVTQEILKMMKSHQKKAE